MILLEDTYWEIKKTPGKGRGIFAKKNIAKGRVIGDYIGTIIHPQEAVIDEENFYLMYYHDRAVISPQVKNPGVHLLNHSCIPNAWLYIYNGHTLAFALRQILKGEEVTIPYLLAPINKFCQSCVHICTCGKVKCSKTMHLSQERYEAWRKLTNRQAKETKRSRIRYGKELPVLSSYPKKIPGEYIEEVNRLLKTSK